MARPAVPATVHLRMRFLKADGAPLADTDYRVRWGSDKAPPTPVAQTDSDGWVDQVLSGSFTRGWVEFGEYPNPAVPDAKTFVPRLRIEVVLVKPPGPASKHKAQSPKNDVPGAVKGKGSPKSGSTGTSSPSSSPPPEPEEEPSEPPEPPPSTPPPPGLISSPSPSKPLDYDPEGRGHATKAHQKKKYSTGIPPEEVERLDRVPLDQVEGSERYAGRRHARQVRVFNLAWRLHNLGFLSLWSGNLAFPIDWGRHADIVDALNRYAYKHGLKLLWESDLSTIKYDPSDPEDPLAEIWDHIEQAHDDP